MAPKIEEKTEAKTEAKTRSTINYSTKTTSELQYMLARDGALIQDESFRRAFLDAANAAERNKIAAARRAVTGVLENIAGTILTSIPEDKLIEVWDRAQGQTANLRILEPDYRGTSALVFILRRQGDGQFFLSGRASDGRRPKNGAGSAA